MAKQRYKVLRAHQGDKWYKEGATRTAEPSTVKHLIGKTLKPIAAKVRATPQNKAVKAPANKAAK